MNVFRVSSHDHILLQRVSRTVRLCWRGLKLGGLFWCICKGVFDEYNPAWLYLSKPDLVSPGLVDHSHAEDQGRATNKCLLLCCISCAPRLCCVWKEPRTLADFALSPSECSTSPLLNLEIICSPAWFPVNWIWNIRSFISRVRKPQKALQISCVILTWFRFSYGAVDPHAPCFSHCHKQTLLLLWW